MYMEASNGEGRYTNFQSINTLQLKEKHVYPHTRKKNCDQQLAAVKYHNWAL